MCCKAKQMAATSEALNSMTSKPIALALLLLLLRIEIRGSRLLVILYSRCGSASIQRPQGTSGDFRRPPGPSNAETPRDFLRYPSPLLTPKSSDGIPLRIARKSLSVGHFVGPPDSASRERAPFLSSSRFERDSARRSPARMSRGVASSARVRHSITLWTRATSTRTGP